MGRSIDHDKELIPIIKWELRTLTHPVCGLLVFASVAVFPTILVPSTPSMWIAGMTFGYGYGFLLIISAAVVGVSLPYFIGHLFCQIRNLVKTIAEASSADEHGFSVTQIVLNILGFLGTVATTIVITTAGDHEERGGSIVALNPRDKL